MTTLEKWQFAQTNMDESLMDESLHEDFKFINHSQGKEFSKRDLIDWVTVSYTHLRAHET